MREHGSFNMFTEAQTIVLEVIGTWNLETAKHWEKEYKKLAGTIENKPWACLVDFTDFEFMAKEVWDFVYEVNLWSNSHNQKLESVICDSKLQRHFLEGAQQPLDNVTVKFFRTKQEAKAWLLDEGFLN